MFFYAILFLFICCSYSRQGVLFLVLPTGQTNQTDTDQALPYKSSLFQVPSKSLKADRSLYPVRALRYYLGRTSETRQNKELAFVTFKIGSDKDISPATISSWMKQAVILCCELSDQEVLALHQVKAHDVMALAAYRLSSQQSVQTA